MKTVLFFATMQEAKETLKTLGAIQEPHNPSHFRFDNGYIICTGVGLKNAFIAATQAPKENVGWVNIGVAGSLDGNSSIGHIFEIGEVGLLRFNQTLKTMTPRGSSILINEGQRATLFSSRIPIYYQLSMQGKPIFVDMEGYSIAYVAKLFKVPLRITKLVSDLCSSTSRSTIVQNLPSLSKQMADYCHDCMEAAFKVL